MTLYNSDIVKVNDCLYDNINTAVSYIKENWISELGIGFFSSEDVELVSVEYGDTGVIVKYLAVGYYDNSCNCTNSRFHTHSAVKKEIQEILEVSYTSMMVTV